MFSIYKNKYGFFGLALLICLFCNSFIAKGGAPKYGVSPFPDYSLCTTIYPTAYAPVGVFSIFETDDGGFKKDQTKTIVLTLPAGFEFNTAAPHSVTFIPAKDITSITLDAVTATTITITVTTDGSEGEIDAILFNNFEVRATAAGSGNLVRTGGDFKIDNKTTNPTTSESLGYLYSDIPMVYDSSRVNQATTVDIVKACATDHIILEIKISATNTCAATITQFNFSTVGDVGFSQNPATNITTAKVYYTAKTQGFTTNNLFGSFAGPNGAFVITGSQQLTGGTGDYYFYLSYDVPPTANTGEGLDAQLVSFVFDGSTKSDMAAPNPTGTRTISSDVCYRPDLPNPSSIPTAIAEKSLVIPMDTAHQSYVSGSIFNLKSYGLVHDLLMNDVPVRWVITTGKARGGIDFSATSRRVWPDTIASASNDFRAGAFIVDSAIIDVAANGFVKTPRQVINDYGNNVEVFELLEPKTLNVRYNLNQRPKIAVFNNGGNDPIHVNVLTEGGVTNYFTVGAGVFTGIDSCFTFCSEPHWAGDLSDSAITNNVKKFISEGGNFLAQCKGIDTYENFSVGNIVSTNGMTIINKTMTHLYSNVDMAFMQYIGDLEENEGGSERNWILSPGSSWRSGFYYAVSHTDIDTIVASGAHIVAPDSVGGNVFYLGGHDYAPFTTLTKINSARMYLNASLIPAGKPTDFDLAAGDTVTICIGDSTQLGGSPTGPPGATYSWNPGLSLDDSTAANPWAKPTDTTTYTVVSIAGGCVVGPRQVVVNVVAAPLVNAGPDDTICASTPNVALSGSVLNVSGSKWSTTGTGTFDDPFNRFTNYNPTDADTAAGSVYLILKAGGICDSVPDSMLLTIQPIPVANAGPDQVICSNNLVANLTGTVFTAIGGTWSTPDGTGSFADVNDLTTTYTATTPDTTAGSVTIVLTTTGNGDCAAQTDTMILTFTGDSLSVQIVPNLPAICFGSAGVGLTAVVSGGNAPYTYLWSTAEITSSIIAGAGGTYYVTVSDNSQCADAVDSVIVVAFGAPISVDAGPDQSVCANSPTVTLAGSVAIADSGRWFNGGGVFVPDVYTLTAAYTPSAAEITAGSATLYLETLGNRGCPADTDTVVITITPMPTVAAAGPDQNLCNVTTTTLAGNAPAVGTGAWSTIAGTGSADVAASPTSTVSGLTIG
ncbi:hypothetical protein JYU20_03320, partial [Bacteroidales bacterium AH-315-I05]|nr:hypothetical protein [Bacteroidales bacterium AH-315-I05]